MGPFNRVGLSLALALVMGGCAKEARTPEMDVCEAIHRAPELLGKQIKLTGWYVSTGFWAFIGSGSCRETLIEPKFGPHTIVEGPVNPPQQTHALQVSLQNLTLPLGDFHGAFYGTLRKRTDSVQSGPVPLDAAPNLDDMPLVLDIDRVTDVRFGRRPTAFLPPEPPPEPSTVR